VAEIRSAFGIAFRFARQRKRWTQEQLAKASGIERSYLSDIERGEVNPSLQILEEIATALDLSLADLFADAERERDRRRVARERAGEAAGQPERTPRARAKATPAAEHDRPTLVAAVIANGDTVLMTRRRYAGEREMWSWPAGHLDPGEQPGHAVLRELNEELVVSDARIVCLLGEVDYRENVSHWWPKSGHFDRGYRMLHFQAALSSTRVEIIDHEELLEADWLTLDQVREATASFPPQLAEAALHFAGEAIRHVAARSPRSS